MSENSVEFLGHHGPAMRPIQHEALCTAITRDSTDNTQSDSQSFFSFNALRILIAIILLSAVSLKINALIVGADRSTSSFHLPMWLVYEAVIVELVLGVWLLLGWHQRYLWMVSLLCFTLFLGVSLHGALTGEKVCGCLGIFSVSPILMSFMDASVVAALIAFPPVPLGKANNPNGIRSSINAFRIGALTALMLSGSLVVVYGVIARSESRKYYESPDLAQKERRGSVQLALKGMGKDLPLFLSEAGFRPQSEIPPDVSLSSFMNQLLSTRTSTTGTIRPISPTAAFNLLTEEGTSAPILFERSDGRLILVAGTVIDQGQRFYEFLVDGGEPALIEKSEFDSAEYRSVWLTQPPAEQGVTYQFGQSTLHIDKAYHNFGVARPYQEEMATFQLSNRGTVPIRIPNPPAVSCGCVAVDFDSTGLIKPGETVPLRASVKTNTASVRQSVSLQFSDSVTDERVGVDLQMIGVQKKSMEFWPKTLDFGTVRIGTESIRRLRVSETPSDRFQILDVRFGQHPLQYKLTEKPGSTGLRNYYLEFSLNPRDLPTQSYSDQLTIVTDSRLLTQLPVPISYRVDANLSVHPPSLAFGPVAKESIVEQFAIIDIPDDVPTDLAITSVASGFSAELESIAANRWKVIVRPQTKTTGALTGTVNVKVTGRTEQRDVAIKCAAYVQPTAVATAP